MKEELEKSQVTEPMVSYQVLDDKGAFSLIEAIRQGIEYHFFEQLTGKFPFSIKEWASFLHLSLRSMQRYKKEKLAFGQVSSERIIEIAMLYKYGLEVFGKRENFDAWLVHKNVGLGQVQPKELLSSTFGIHLIKDELTRIEHGVLA